MSTTHGTASLSSSLAHLIPLAFKRARGLQQGASLPDLHEEAALVVDPHWLHAYRSLVGAVDDGCLPSCAPQVLAVGLHLRLLGDARYPLPVLGMVHVRNVIDERRAIAAGAALRLRARWAAARFTPRGIEIDIVTEVRVDDAIDVPWRSTMTALVRTHAAPRGADKTRASDDDSARSAIASSSIVAAPADLGRRYARIAGDANPIHLSAWTARPFGFPRAIAHGMWTLQRALAEVHDALPRTPRRIEARFVKPVLLPGRVVVERRSADGGAAHIVVRPMRDGAPHVLVDVASLDPALDASPATA